jgi:hypothetical protein
MIDHLVYWTPDLEASIEELAERLGVHAAEGGRHPGRGTRNALLSFGEGRYLEVIGPDLEQAEPATSSPFGPSGEGASLTTWAAKAADLDARVEAARAAGTDIGVVMDMSRDRLDGVTLHWRLSRGERPGDGLVPFLIDWGETEHPAETSPGGLTLVALRGEHPDPDAIRGHLAALGVADDLEVTRGNVPRLIATIEGPTGRVELS